MKKIQDTEVKEKLTFSKRIKKFWNNSIKNMSSIRQILIWYLVISLIGALLLWFPFSQQANVSINIKFIDALFISASSFSDTGLSTVVISDQFNWFGQLVMLILLNIGGVGWFTIKIFILTYILRRNTNYNIIEESSSEIGTKTKNDTLGLVFMAIIISVFSTFFFGIIFGIIFATIKPISSFNENLTGDSIISPDLVGNWGKAIWAGIFHASASVNNSGFDIFSGNSSLQAYAGNIGIQIITMFLFILGGIGFGIFYDIKKWFVNKKTGQRFSFSIITKLSISIYFIVAFVGLIMVYISEGLATINNPDAFLNGNDLGMRIWAITFNTFSTRNAGFSTMDISFYQTTTIIIQSLMMFIGSGPGSTAGGLRTTTFGVVIISIYSFVRNKKSPTIFGRSISDEIVKDAMAIFVCSITLIFVSITLLSISESLNNQSIINDNKSSFLVNMFMVFSAFGTTGLSLSSPSDYNMFSKFLLIIIMFIGQMGMSTTLSQVKTKQMRYQKKYIEEYINLG